MNHTSAGVPAIDARHSAKHYENEAGFFRSFLDPYMKYGSGYFVRGDSFEQASVRMLDKAIDASALPRSGNVRVLDVGSGWGSLFRRLRERVEGLEYHQINPSDVQRGFIARSIGKADFTYAGGIESASLGEGAYDAVFFHDSFCHVCDKKGGLAKAARALMPTGRLVMQDTFFVNESARKQHAEAATTRLIQKEVFGYAEIPSIQALLEDAADAGLAAVSLEDVSEHYRQTVAAWLARLEGCDATSLALLQKATMQMLYRGAACLGCSTLHYFAVFAPHRASRRTLRDTLRWLQSGRLLASTG
jgi:cyclopropane-fatty-acyl-phospholipid synthase